MTTSSLKPHEESKPPYGGVNIEAVYLTKVQFNTEALSEDGEYGLGFEIDHHLDEKDSSLYLSSLEIDVINPEGGVLFSVEYGAEIRVGEVPIPLDYMTSVNFPAYLFPFVRETIMNLSLKAGIEPVILPTINFAQMYENSKKGK